MKKVIAWFILVSFINLTGCYSRDLIAPSSYKFDEKKDITIVTNDTTYKFKGYQYILMNDTLLGATNNVRITEATPVESIVKVPVNDIQLVEVTGTDGGKTVLLIAGIAAVSYIIIALTAHPTFGDIRLNLH